MITEYNRPDSVASALALLARKTPQTHILAGGTGLILRKSEDFAVVDIQDLSLNSIQKDGERIRVGACVTLQQLLDSADLPEAIRTAARTESSFNIRQAATLGGTIASANGHSPLLAILLADNVEVYLAQQEKPILLGELLPLRAESLQRQLITEIAISDKPFLAYEKISKTPDDVPLIVASVAQWPGGRTRVVVGGSLDVPKLAMDGTSPTGADVAASNLFSGTDLYLSEMAGILVNRCLQKLKTEEIHEH